MLTLLLTLPCLAAPIDPAPALVAVAGPRPMGLTVQPRTVVAFPGGGRVAVGGQFDGVVLRGDLPVVAVTADGSVRRVHGALPALEGPSQPVLSAAEVQPAALAAVAGFGPPSRHGTPTLAWWARAGVARLSWAVPVRTAGPGLATWEVLVDAESGVPHTVRRTSATADALIYDPNPVVAEVEQVALATADLTGPWADARSCDEIGDGTLFDLGVCGLWSHQAQPDDAGDYLFRPKEGASPDPFAEVQAFVHADRMLSWLDTRYDLRLPYGPIDVFVNFPLANAFFGDFDGDDQPDISFGHEPSTGIDFGYDGDVVYHELGHAVVNHLAPDLPFLQADELGMDWVSGSANEGAADVFAMVLTGDPDMAEYAGSAFGRMAIRELAEPRRCPDALEGQVHHDGEILGSMAWGLQAHPDVGAEAVGDLLIGAIPLWGAEPTWAGIADSLAWSADDLLDAGALSATGHGAVLAALDASGLRGCERVHELGLDEPRSMFLLSAGLEPPYDHVPGATQVRIDVPARAAELVIEELQLSAGGGLGWAVVGRVGSPVAHDTLSLAGVAIATPTTYDWLVDVERGEVVLSADGDAPLVPGQPLYLSITGRAAGDIDPLAFVQGQVSFLVREGDAPDDAIVQTPRASLTDRDAGSTEHLGLVCGCSSAAPSPLPMGLGLWLLRRRRRGSGDTKR